MKFLSLIASGDVYILTFIHKGELIDKEFSSIVAAINYVSFGRL